MVNFLIKFRNTNGRKCTSIILFEIDEKKNRMSEYFGLMEWKSAQL